MRSKTDSRLIIMGAVAVLIAATGSACNRVSAEKSVYTSKYEAVETRLRQLEAREEIRRLLADYGRFLDQRDFVSFSRLFAEKEGEWIGGMGRAKGSESIRKLMENTIGKDTGGSGSPNYHLFTNEAIDLDGDRATASTKWIFVIQNSVRQPQPFFLGHYEDTIIRENGRWRFLKRTVYSDIPADNSISQPFRR